MYKLLFLILVSVFALTGRAVESFPQRCEGTWQGMMQISFGGHLVDSVPVRLTIARLEDTLARWSWKTEYLSESRPVVKDYMLMEEDNRRGVYLLDEGDGVKLPGYVFGDVFYSAFRVQRTLLTATYELRGEALFFTVTSGRPLKGKKKRIRSYSYEVVQQVVFRRLDG